MKKIILIISILSLLIIAACSHTGNIARDLTSEDIKPNYAKPYEGCTHQELRCNDNIQERCYGGYWHTEEFCELGCENNRCSPSPHN